MLINATHSEEIRVALADGQKLYNLDIDIPGQDRKKGNIYKGKITRVEPSLEAAFVDYGADRHGFLPYKEISRNYYTAAANKMKERPPIAVAVKEGTEVIIQVNKEERGNKGAAISTYVSLAGRYLVYMPENPKAGGISRRIEGKARQELKASLDKVTVPKDSGVIVRTAGIGRSSEELEWDLNYLDQVWTAIKAASVNRKAPCFLYQESDIAIRALRDYFRPDIGEILIDDKELFEKIRDFMQQVMPHNLKRLSYYNDTIPLFSRYQIESQIQSAFSREVQLPSGGSLVIDHTEALISIDINSARATKGADIEETATNTNLEAADEIARQMRIRDLGGLVVIDFIDMRNHKNQRSVELQLAEAVSNDRARIQIGKISRFGLLEMSRQRLKSSINESSQFVCPRCSGHGFIRNIESLAVSILRILEEESLKPETGKVIAQVPTKVANFIINDKREELNSLESRHSVPMLIVANEHYQSPQFDIQRLKKSEAKNVDINNITLNKPESEESAENKSSQNAHPKRQVAAVDVLVPDSQAPSRSKSSGSILSWIKTLFTPDDKPVKKTNNNSKHRKPQHNQNKPYNKQHNKNTRKKPVPNNNKNKQNNQGIKAPNKGQANNQDNKNNKPNNKQGKNQPNKQQNKQQNNAKAQAPQNQKQQNKPKHNNKPQQPKAQKQAQKQQPKAQASQQQSNPVAEDAKTNEQLLQRPLGSVASYAANKAKQESKPQQEASMAATAQGKETTKPVVAKTEIKTDAQVEVKQKNKSVVDKTSPTSVKSGDKVLKETTKKEAPKPAPKKSDAPVEAKKEKAKASQAGKSKAESKSDKSEKKPEAMTKIEPKAKTEEKAEIKVKAEPKAKKSKIDKPNPEITEKPKLEKAPAKVKKPVSKVAAKPKSVEKKSTVKKEVKANEKKETAKKVVKAEDKTITVTKEESPKPTKPAVKKPAKPKKKIPDPTSNIDFDI